jgi:hypothetical protein
MPLSQENRMQTAIHAYQNKQIQYQSKAARVFGVPTSNLQDRLKRTKSRSETRANCHKLTAYEEEFLTKHLLNAYKQSLSIQLEFLRGIALILLRERTQDPTTSISVN